MSSNYTQLTDLIRNIWNLIRIKLNDKLVTTGNYPFSIQIHQGVVCASDDTTITHEKADIMIIEQVAYGDAANILILADDTCVFGHLCHFV